MTDPKSIEPTQADSRFYIDCEFDGHNGPLLSIALVSENGQGIHIATTAEAQDPWVIANVVPLIDKHDCRMTVRCLPNEVGTIIRTFVKCDAPVIIADSPVDIARFCQALSTGTDGGWASTDYPRMSFEVHNVDCYPTDLPGAVQHNAWWDAMALHHRIASAPASGEVVAWMYELDGDVVLRTMRREGQRDRGWTETPLYAAPSHPAADLVEALQYAVDMYGKPGGPWNVPSDPGGWLDRARAALSRYAGGA